MLSIMLTGAGGSASSNLARCLRMAGGTSVRLVGTDTRPEHLHAAPHLDARHLVPRADHDHYLGALRDLCQRYSVDVILPQPDVEVGVLARLSGDVPAAVPLPSAAAMERCLDKAACQEALERAGVAVPASSSLDSLGGDELAGRIAELAAHDPDGRVWVRARRGAGSRAALPVRTAAQAEHWLAWWQDMRGVVRDEFMVSQYLPGDEFAFQGVWHHGTLVTSAARRRVEYLFGHLTPSGQTSTPSLAVSVHDEEVNRVGVAAVHAVDAEPHGVFGVDMKCDRDGQPCVTEINAGRFFTTCDFFAEAGANMPWTLVQLAVGAATPEELGPVLNAVPPDLWWVRNIDVPPALVPAATWNVHASIEA